MQCLKVLRALSLLLIHTRFDDVTWLSGWNKFRGLGVDCSQKLEPWKFSLARCKVSEPRFNPAYFRLSSHPNSNRTLSLSMFWRLSLKPSRKPKCYVSTQAWTRRRCKAESGTCCGSNHFYECPGYEAIFLATLKQRAEYAISVDNSRHLLSL